MELSPLTAISPVDGRYWSKVGYLSEFFSEYSLIKYRVRIEIEYFIALVELPLPQLIQFDKTLFGTLRSWYENFSEEDAKKVKDIERKTNHDVKAVEYFVKDKMDELKLDDFKEFVHFGLTSQDINNTSIPLSLKDFVETQYVPSLDSLIEVIKKMANKWIEIPMLARTHGQPATPTRVGKELAIFAKRLEQQKKQLLQLSFTAKFGGATGAFNAHYIAYPSIDWIEWATRWVSSLGLEREEWTTQISNYDNLAALFDASKRINTILIDLARDCWHYISLNYFKQKVNPNEVGSSAMPHKVNPIDFENAEGNLGIANAMFEHLAAKLPVSRLQRDLTDSTVLRNIGVPFTHTLLSFSSVDRGLKKLILNEQEIQSDLQTNWMVVAEALQTILRRERFPKPYETLKELTRGAQVTEEMFHSFISTLDVSTEVKAELLKVSPFTFIGKVPSLE